MKEGYGAGLLAKLPGLAGDVARFVDTQLECSSPHISIPAGLALVSAVKAGRVECKQQITPNLYCCVVAGSGTGKTQAQKAVQDLILAAEMQSLLMGKPASDSGLLKALQDQNRKFLIWDEFGIALGELSKSQASYRALILSTLMDLFSASGKIYLGKEYATQARVDVKEPHLSIFAAATPNRFFGSLNTDFVEDGFLSRWLLFFSPDKSNTTPSAFPKADNMVDRLRAFNDFRPGKKGNLAQVFSSDKIEIVIPDNHIASAKSHFKYKMESAKNEIHRIFWSRAFEQYVKITLTICDDFESSFDDYLIAVDLIENLVQDEIDRCETLLYTSERERTKEKFRNLLKSGETASLSALTRRSYRLNLSRSERHALIDDLLDSGLWIKEMQPGSGQRKQAVFRCA